MPKSLLVADDSVVIQKSVGITFAQEDFTITYVTNGNDALIKAKQVRPDCILADIVMPQKNGYDLCQLIRQDPQLKQIPVLLMAGTHEPFDEAKSKAVGASGFIIKPFESQALLDRVHSLLSQPMAVPPPPPAVSPTPTSAPPKPAAQPSMPSAPLAVPQAASPASTIAGQMPISRDAPLLDMDASSSEPAFELSLDQTENLEGPIVDAGAVSAGSTQTETPSGTLPAGDFWDFSSEAPAETPPVTAAATPLPTDSLDAGAWGTISAGSWEEIEKTPAPPAQEESMPAFGEPSPNPQDTSSTAEASAGDFGFDLSSGENTQTQVTDGATVGSFEAPVTDHYEAPTKASIDLSPSLPVTDAQIEAIVTKVFQRVIERIAWEVVPELAETIIKEELARLTQNRS